MLLANGLECVRGERRLFRDVGFELDPGTLLHVQGRNGSGKTSLLRMLCGLLAPEAGDIQWNGTDVRALGESYRGELFYLGHQNAIKDDLTPTENLLVSETLAEVPVTRASAREALARLGLAGYEDLPTRVLSQGQKRRVALARLLSRERSRLWLLDEPFVALDPLAVTELTGIISDQLGGDGIVVYTTHQDVNIAARKRVELRLGK
ncbi:MAG: cytochrome c biogenesis heme-transporting ATPase CcmA [Burkholderiales bacterium]